MDNENVYNLMIIILIKSGFEIVNKINDKDRKFKRRFEIIFSVKIRPLNSTWEWGQYELETSFEFSVFVVYFINDW